jgi:methionyl-tRNA formyltransferase
MNKELRIIFMGTPEFAVASLQKLVEAGKNIVAVITAPDKPAGRGMQLQHSPVKEYAVQQGLKILQPEKLKDETFLNELRELKADLQIVVAFRMLPEVVWNMPPLGTFNLHASLLPQYRGAAPIHWAVINGEKETGVTTFFLQHEIDTGNIILQEKIAIGEEETTGELYERLMHLGARKVLETVELIEKGNVKTTPQQFSEALKAAPKIFKEMCRIQWNSSAQSIFNFVRGMNPSPCAWTLADDRVLKIHRVGTEITTHHYKPGTLITEPGKLKVAVNDGFVTLLEIRPEGKRKMSVTEFLAGNKISKID